MGYLKHWCCGTGQQSNQSIIPNEEKMKGESMLRNVETHEEDFRLNEQDFDVMNAGTFINFVVQFTTVISFLHQPVLFTPCLLLSTRVLLVASSLFVTIVSRLKISV